MITRNGVRASLTYGFALKVLALLGASAIGISSIATPVMAQDFQTIAASGRVQGPDGTPISAATVTVTSNAQGFSRTATTGRDGGYRIPQLPTGTYTFTIKATGFDTFTDPAVSLSQNASGNAFTLAPAGAANNGDIVIVAKRVAVADFEGTTTGAVINVSDIANRVPVGRDLNSIIQLTPGASQGDSAFGSLPSIGGASVGENQYFVNGLNVTNFRTFLGANTVPFEFYDTIEVKDGGYQAEYGRSTGGFISATTKSGSNDFHAGLGV